MSSFSRDDRAVELSAAIPIPDPYIARANDAANVVTAADDIVPSATSLIPNLVPDSGRAAGSSVSAAEAAAPAVALAQVPDGGWGWIVTCSCFFMHLVVLGSIYSFGVFLPVYVIEFSQGRGEYLQFIF